MKKLLLVALLFVGVLSGCDTTTEEKIEEYTITFETNGGEVIDSIVNPVTDKYYVQEEPTREGFEFDDWFIDEELTEKHSGSINTDTTLYAKWEEITFRLIFVTGDGDSVAMMNVPKGERIDLPDTRINRGEFLGWVLEDSGDIIEGLYEMPAETVYLHAVYEMIEVSIKMTLITDLSSIDSGFMENVWEGINEYCFIYNYECTYVKPVEFGFDGFMDAVEVAVTEGAETIVLPGWIFENVAYGIQVYYPDVNVILLDGIPNNVIDWGAMVTIDDAEISFDIEENTYPVLYLEQEAGFLAGYAAVMDGYRELGFIGGMAVPAVVRYGYGFIEGVNQAASELGLQKEDVTIKYFYCGYFSPDASLQATAEQWYTNGTEVIFGVSGGGIRSIIQAAENQGGKVIGVDIDMAYMSDTVITSAIKDFGQSVFYAADVIDSGMSGGDVITLGLEDNAVRLAYDFTRFTTFTAADYHVIVERILTGDVTIEIDEMISITEFAEVLDYVTLIEE